MMRFSSVEDNAVSEHGYRQGELRQHRRQDESRQEIVPLLMELPVV